MRAVQTVRREGRPLPGGALPLCTEWRVPGPCGGIRTDASSGPLLPAASPHRWAAVSTARTSFEAGVAVVGADSSAEAPLTTSVANRGMIGAGAVPLKGAVLSRGTTMTGEDSAICPVLVWAGEVLERATRVFRAVTLLPNALGFVRSALVVRSRRADLHLIDPSQPRCIYIPVSGTCDPHRPVCYRI